MRYKFSNLCGAPYKQGNILFSPDGYSLYSPIGNRVTKFDLMNNVMKTLPVEARKDVRNLCLDPIYGKILVIIDVDGRAIVFNTETNIVLHRINFKAKVKFIEFSPCAQFLSVCLGSRLQVWKFHIKSKNKQSERVTIDYSQLLALHKVFFGHRDTINHVSWFYNSRFLLTSSSDGSCRLFAISDEIEKDYQTITLSGHKGQVRNSFFIPKEEINLEDSNLEDPINWKIVTVSSSGLIMEYVWINATIEDNFNSDQESQASVEVEVRDSESSKWSVLNGGWAMHKRHELYKAEAQINCSSIQEFHISHVFNKSKDEIRNYLKKTLNYFVIGYTSGTFSLYELKTMNLLQELSVSRFKISTISISRSGEWISIGSGDLGQISVWEWKSETFVLKQQGHLYNIINYSSFSPNGNLIATGGDDGKVKVWSTRTGFCFVTFSDHAGPISCIKFGPSGNVIISSSLDGTVRAFDLVRYRNFRIMTSPDENVQFTCCTIDGSGELVCAGSKALSRIYIWKLKTGEVIDVLNGHEGPISSIDIFGSLLSSSSWDGSLRLWDVYGGKCERIESGVELLCTKIRPDGKQVSTSGINGKIYFFSTDTANEQGTIEGRRDIVGGRKVLDRRTLSSTSSVHCFTSISYTASGKHILAGGRSKYVCLYHVKTKLLLKKFQISCNRSLDGVLDKLNSKNLLLNGAVEEMEVSESDSEVESFERKYGWNLKGGDITQRTTVPEIRSKSVEFSPTNEQFIVSSTEGLLVYSLDSTVKFDPMDLSVAQTPESILNLIKDSKNVEALLSSLNVGEDMLTSKVIELVTGEEIKVVANSLKKAKLKALLEILASKIEISRRVEFYTIWLKELLTVHSDTIRNNSVEYVPSIRRIQKALLHTQSKLTKLYTDNKYQTAFLLS